MLQKLENKIIVAMMCMSLMLATPVIVQAGDIQPLASPCYNCNRGQLLPSKSYGKWVNAGERKCTHKPYGTDLKQERKVTTTYKCNICGAGYDESSKEAKWICHGYN